MPRAKYQQYLNQMYEENEDTFAAFRQLHDLYSSDKKQWQEKFNQEGKPILRIIEDYEKRLCSQMESGYNASYSNRLAEKFREAVKKDYPLIDFIGVIRR